MGSLMRSKQPDQLKFKPTPPMLRLRPYYTPNLCALQLSLGAHVCDDERCGAMHGRSLSAQFTWWGLELEYVRA
jgi:hypothetical protein